MSLLLQYVWQEWAEGWAGEEETADRSNSRGEEEKRRGEEEEGCKSNACIFMYSWRTCQAAALFLFCPVLCRETRSAGPSRAAVLLPATKTRTWRGRGGRRRLCCRASASPLTYLTVKPACFLSFYLPFTLTYLPSLSGRFPDGSAVFYKCHL